MKFSAEVSALSASWSAYLEVLRERAPVTATSIRPPRPPAEREAAERATTPWTDDVREFFSLHDGQIALDGDDPTGTVFPDRLLMSLNEVVDKHRECSDPAQLHTTDDISPTWAVEARLLSAGEPAHMFLEAYLPFAEDGTGGIDYVDTRRGAAQGCIRYFDWEGADEGTAAHASLADYLDSVRRSVETDTEHDGGLIPVIEDGALIWGVDFSDQPAPDQQPPPAVVRLPFALTDFRPSQVSDSDDLMDLDAVRQAVIDTARSLHPNADVVHANAIYRQVPRQRGVSITWIVSIDGGEGTFYSAIVTGVGDEVLVYEVPPGGFTIEVDE